MIIIDEFLIFSLITISRISGTKKFLFKLRPKKKYLKYFRYTYFKLIKEIPRKKKFQFKFFLN